VRLGNSPSTLITTLNDQPEEKRLVLHLLHYVPERRGRAFDTVEDVIPLHNIEVSLRADLPLKGAKLVPRGGELESRTDNGRLTFTVPVVEGWQMVELSYA
jgi:hypothetical protein